MPLRILHIVTYMGRGGLETFLMNCYRLIDRDRIQFDFLVHRSFRAEYDDEIEALGGRIYRISRLNPVDPGYHKALKAFFRSHGEYKIVHCHLDCMSALPLSAARSASIPVRIAHAHSASQDKDWKYPLKRFYMHFIPSCATHYFACSEAAGSWMFPHCNFTVVRNGIQTESFRFDQRIRQTTRKALSLEDKLVIGHVGRFSPAKNHDLLIDVFFHVHAMRPDSRLLLVGDGELRTDIERKVNRLNLADCVVFAREQEDISPFYQAMDLFVFPSLYEGFGIAALEAQASGLPCVLSQEIPPDCMITDLVTQLPLENCASVWAKHILSRIPKDRQDYSKAVREKGLDIEQTENWLQHFYLETGM